MTEGQKKEQETQKPTRVDLMEQSIAVMEQSMTTMGERIEKVEEEFVNLGMTLLELTEKVDGNTGVDALAKIIAVVAGNGGKKHAPKFGGSTGAKKVKDTKTGITYDSLSKCAKAVASDFGFSPDDHFAWYPIYKADPDRFEIQS